MMASVEDKNTHYVELTGTAYSPLSAYPSVDFKNGYYYKNVDGISTFNFPTTTFGGPLTASQGPLSADGGVIFTQEISGGPLVNFTYNDFSGLDTKVDLGLYFCTPTVYVSLSNFDTTVSPILKFIYQSSPTSKLITLNSVLSVQPLSTFVNTLLLPPLTPTLKFEFTPSSKYITTYNSFLSVLRLDGTINTFTFLTSVAQCEMLELYDTANILNSQILDSSDYVLLTLENSNNKTVYNSILNTSLPFYLLSGGDTTSLEDIEVEPITIFDLDTASQAATEFIADQIRQIALPEIPQPKSKINPITPEAAEYYYRGVRGIRVRPLIAKLLPGETFYYAIPQSGLIITTGGAPYLPGLGISFDVRFRVL